MNTTTLKKVCLMTLLLGLTAHSSITAAASLTGAALGNAASATDFITSLALKTLMVIPIT